MRWRAGRAWTRADAAPAREASPSSELWSPLAGYRLIRAAPVGSGRPGAPHLRRTPSTSSISLAAGVATTRSPRGPAAVSAESSSEPSSRRISGNRVSSGRHPWRTWGHVGALSPELFVRELDDQLQRAIGRRGAGLAHDEAL